jgi:hypothetical protein
MARVSVRTAVCAAVLSAASLALVACGSSPRARPAPTILNTEKVERAIEASSLSQRRQTVLVSCPSGVLQNKGLVFFCVAVGAGARTRFVVTQVDDAGHVHYEAP